MIRSLLCLSSALSLSVLTAFPTKAASPETVLESKLRAIEAILDTQLAHESVPGAAFGIVADQDLVWSHTYGIQDLQSRMPVDEDTAFSICSISKLFTGIAVMDLDERGLIDIDAPITTYLGADGGAADDVTVRNLLSHVSGLPREGETDFWFTNQFPDDATLLADVSGRTDWYAPYDHWQYSNLGMAALGQVIQSASGQSFHDYVEARILNPLGMDNTTTDMPFDIVGQGFARGYYVRDPKGNRQPVEPHEFDAFASAAGVASSVNDMARFMAWHFRLRDSEAEEILQPETLKTMQRVHWTGEDFDEPAWGLAYATRRLNGKTLWGHGGYCPGTVAQMTMRNPDKVGVVMMATANDVSSGGLSSMIHAMVRDDVKTVYIDSSDDEADDSEDSAAEDSASFAEFEGRYDRPNYHWSVYIGQTSDGLFAVPLYANRPHEDVDMFRHEDGDIFIRKRDDGSDAEPLRFIRDASGNIVSVVSGGYRLLR
ncbi:MAG: serine hydrolase domain-containing protein, partial [Pseudomonadota bacterium]